MSPSAPRSPTLFPYPTLFRTYAVAQQVGGIGMAELVGDGALGGTSGGAGRALKGGAQTRQQVLAPAGARQQKRILGGVVYTQNSDPRHGIANLRVGGNPPFGEGFGRGNADRPVLAAHMMQTIEREFDQFAGAQAGAALQQQSVRRQIVASAQCGLDAFVVLG